MNRIRSLAVRAFLTASAAAIAPAALAQQSDSVLSRHVKEADGTTGQDTNTGSGIKTGHLQNGSVTAVKLAAGAVTDAAIAGPISAAKIEPGVFQLREARVITVAEQGGDFANPADALAWIQTQPTPFRWVIRIAPGTYNIAAPLILNGVDLEGSGEETTRLVGAIVAPPNMWGLFTVATVIVGPSSEVRFLTVENVCPPNPAPASYVAAIKTEGGRISHVSAIASGAPVNVGIAGNPGFGALISHATVRLSGPGSNIGIEQNSGNPDAVIEDSRVYVTSTDADAMGIYVNESTGFAIRNTTVKVSAPLGAKGINLIETNAVVSGVSVVADGGSEAYGFLAQDPNGPTHTVRLENSSVSSTGTRLFNSEMMFVANTRISGDGPLVIGIGPLRCFGTYDDSLNPVACP